MRPLFRALLLAALLSAGMAAPPAAAQTNRIVAVVNGDIVTTAEIEARRRLFAINAGIAPSQQSLERLTPQVTRLLIDERLRLQEVRRRRIPVGDNDVAAALQDLERRNNLPPGGLVAQLRRAGVEPRALYDQLRAQIGWARLLRTLLGSQAEPGEAEVNDWIAAQRARTGQQEYLVSEVFIPLDDPAEEPEVRRFVDDVVGQLRAGAPFPIVATQFSQAQSALQGGDLGWVGAEALDPEIARIVPIMPVGAISNAMRVPGGFQIVALRGRREVGRDEATMLSLRQVFFAFSSPLVPNQPTPQQIQQLERAQALGNSARSCEAMEAAGRAQGGDRPVDPGQVRQESLNPPQLRAMVAALPVGRASQPIIAPDGILVLMVCSRERRNEAEITPEMARSQIVRERAELLSRQTQRELRRRAQIEMRQS
jgi:peptidyl-prolyl cis-trans isomerase SurA